MSERKELDHAETVARRKLPDMPADWRPYKFEAVGEFPNASTLMTFAACRMKTLRSGPNKGKERREWYGPSRQAIVTPEERDAEQRRYEKETGRCGSCDGTREEWAGWSVMEGNRYRPCTRCGATGNAL